MSNVFCLDITEMAPSVSAFQLVHIFGLHEICFPTVWVQNQKSLRLKIKEKMQKKLNIYWALGGELHVHLRMRGVNWFRGNKTLLCPEQPCVGYCECLYWLVKHPAHFVLLCNKTGVLGQVRSWVKEQSCRDKESIAPSKSHGSSLFLLNSSFKQC